MTVNRAALSRAVAIHNGKGGVGKTSLASNLAVTLGAAGIHTLVVDLDPQANLALDLGYAEESDNGAALRDSLLTGAPLPEPLQVREHVSVIPGGVELFDVDAEGKSHLRDNEHELLAAQLVPLSEDFDVILMDTPPNSRSSLTAAALGAAHHLIIPTRIDRASLDGLALAQIAVLPAREVNPFLALAKVVITQHNPAATAMLRETLEELTATLDGHSELIMDGFIRDSSKAAAIQRKYGITISEQLTAAYGIDVWSLIRAGKPLPEISDEGTLVDSQTPRGGDRVRIEKAGGAPGLHQDYTALTKMLVEHINTYEQQLVAELEEQA